MLGSCHVLCRLRRNEPRSDSLLPKFSLVTRRHPSDVHSGVGQVALATEELRVMGRKLYVGNLPYETGESDLQDLFARAGSVESVTVMRDQATGRARGFAFVEMSSDDEAQKAITELNAFSLGGRNLTVNEARPKADRSGGFGGGDSYRRRSEPRW